MNEPPDNSNARESAGAVAGDMRLPIEVVLEALADDLDDKQLRVAINEIVGKLKSGQSIDDALSGCKSSTPSYLHGLLRSATTADKLADICDSLVRIRGVRSTTWLTIRSVLAYPLLLLVAFIAMACLLAWFVVPPFVMLYDEFALELPPVTEAFLSIVNWAPWTLCGVLALLVSVTSLPRLFGTGFAIRNALPIFGKLYVSLSHEEFSRTLASFVKLRMPLNDALEYTASLMQDQSLAAAARRLASQVATGTPLSTAMHKSRHFERSLAVIANWGEAGSSLDDSLELAADMYAERRRQRLHLLRRIVPPFTLVAVASMALATVVPIMLPLISLVESLS